MVNEICVVDNLRLENQLTELTSLVRQLAIGQHQPSIAAKVYGICTFVKYPTDMCPTLQEIDVHAGTLSMEFAMKHHTKDHSLFGIDLIDELVEEHFQLDTDNDDISNFAGDTDIFDCLGSIPAKVNDDESGEVHNLSDFKDDIINLADLICKYEDSGCSSNTEVQVAKTKKQLSAQVAMMFITKYELANRSRD
ncbi:hypothetical protein CR513_25793, partial [Mucuna pruriens]